MYVHARCGIHHRELDRLSLGAGSSVKANADVDVNALSHKNVQTYAISVGGGFVGVAGSVSVWTVGTQATTTYDESSGATDRGDWTSGVAYNTDASIPVKGKVEGNTLVLRTPASGFGLGYGSGAHAPNEFFVIDSSNPKVLGMVDSAMGYVDMLYELATIR